MSATCCKPFEACFQLHLLELADWFLLGVTQQAMQKEQAMPDLRLSAGECFGAAPAFCSDSPSFILFAAGSSSGVLGFWLVLAEVACSGLAISVRASAAIVAVARAAWSSVFLAGAGVLLGDIAGAGVFLGAIVISVGRAVLSSTEHWRVATCL